MNQLTIPKGKKVYFASDNHLGAPNNKESLPREKKFVAWLDSIQKDAAAIYLMGDLFDFWFEYKKVVPKGFTRTLGKLAELSDQGIPITYFVGNHDLWMNGYFEEELNIPVYHKPQELMLNSTKFLIGHGDGLGPGDKGFKIMKKVFINPVSKWFFRWLHPDIGVRFAQYLSVNNKIISGEADAKFLGEDQEWLVRYCKRKLALTHYDYFIFGHRHLPLEINLNKTSTYINLGDWISYFTYAVFDGEKLTLEKL
ncbi:MAG: UDP-2,3-diacylglucosamine diphosphatase [Croceitalea sp.]|nr:UDP-2,3-diacylglucosamine diphosphatase [Croceitalea sp.]MBT8238517.1 UDP-2,3-diacylglucosamine diphosphatase [Croceitalea sp.]NNC33307.1 UDP-2,3-diacylglucosamine diphosphatase [Croceitalea sp.]NNL08203.1 UDP-2,3-diacylglucosamine diphosphatase [Croceitalea sp.]NNM18991.1 UDP-2,3-diacylglucosamine diphosphatase [Croceitalea sp.]